MDLKSKRHELGKTQQELADELGLHRVTISRIEAGIPPSRPTAERISRHFDGAVSVVELMFPNGAAA